MRKNWIKVKQSESPIAWYNELQGQIFEVLEVSPWRFVKILYDKECNYYGWVSPDGYDYV